ncbi:hypothetical protein BPLS_P3286 [Bathymodiolus platifrons methanotrophic gill symbiont]|uniref:DUF4209 domain-containing protein n=1 Tax=Bathymodiolus platifrons methanotrophic gill symbiont TaxID=113268 RepID=UPI001B3CBE8F|nr:DUF4209 domain-containing protein [Bathymodiolus platifrons methanotrophic gill symbiont]GFO75838.1 hypothetical protein BPLS_P3286 [Bathymodiolus platifrons methanotrophic gill symbiont]
MEKKLSKSNFIACEWHFDKATENHHGYEGVMESLSIAAREKEKLGESEQAEILNLLSNATSMYLSAEDINQPFKPFWKISNLPFLTPDSFTQDALVFFEEILPVVDNMWLKARLADLLWLCKKKGNVDHAKIAVNAYISHSIDSGNWHIDVSDCFHRAIILCKKINYKDGSKEIKNKLYTSFQKDSPMCRSLAQLLLLNELDIKSNCRVNIVNRLITLGKKSSESGDYLGAIDFFHLAEKEQKNEDESEGLNCLLFIADSNEKEGDLRSSDSQGVAQHFYKETLKYYLKIPKKYREELDVQKKIKTIRQKIEASGKKALPQMMELESAPVDISDSIKKSREHVSGKESLRIALWYFSTVYIPLSFKDIKEFAQKLIENPSIINDITSTIIAQDGRCVANVPGISSDGGDAALNHKIQTNFRINTSFAVEGHILPALYKLHDEYSVTLPILISLCECSVLVPKGRENLTAYALWLGFNRDFGNAIHLLCPQFENMIRVELKRVGAHTRPITNNHIEHEICLSSLMDLPECKEVFGEDLVFEIKSIFTDPLGSNLRNDVAHGLLDDSSSSSIQSVYAWWMILKMIIHHRPKNSENGALAK